MEVEKKRIRIERMGSRLKMSPEDRKAHLRNLHMGEGRTCHLNVQTKDLTKDVNNSNSKKNTAETGLQKMQSRTRFTKS